MKEYRPIKEGKVREIYDTGDNLILVVTDRISAFDHILKNKITGKGKILTQMSKFWFDYTKDIVDNHMVSTDVNDMPEFFRNEKYEGRSMMHSQRLYHGVRLGFLQGERNGVRDQASRGAEGIRAAA